MRRSVSNILVYVQRIDACVPSPNMFIMRPNLSIVPKHWTSSEDVDRQHGTISFPWSVFLTHVCHKLTSI